MNRSLLTAGLTACCLAGAAVHASATAQGGQAGAANPPATKTAEQLRYEEEQRRYQAEQERHRQSVIEAEEARQRYERDRAQHEDRLERIRRQQVERGMRVPRRSRERDPESPVGQPAAASAPTEPSAPAAPAASSPAAAAAPANATPPTAPTSPASTERAGAPAVAAPSGGSNAPATVAGSGDAAAAGAETTQCDQRRERNRRRGRRAGGVFGFVARTFIPFGGGVVSAVTAIVPVGELLGEAIAGLLDCDEQQRAATATEEAVRGGVGTTASWTSETRTGVSGSSTVLALQEEPGGAACMTVTDVVIVDGEETQAPKRLCRRPPSSRFVRV